MKLKALTPENIRIRKQVRSRHGLKEPIMSSDLKELADELKGFLDRSCINDGAEKFLREVESALRTLASREKKPFGWLGNDGKFSLPFDVTREQFLSHFAGHDLPTGTPVIPLYTAPQKPPPAAGWDEELLSIISALDRASGDTDPSGIGTDEECREQYPVIWAMQQLCKMREALRTTPAATKSADAGGGVREDERERLIAFADYYLANNAAESGTDELIRQLRDALAAPSLTEPVYKAVERILDEKSAWIARPNDEVTKSIALQAVVAAHKIIAESCSICGGEYPVESALSHQPAPVAANASAEAAIRKIRHIITTNRTHSVLDEVVAVCDAHIECDANVSAVLQNDLAEMLRALGMSDAAQPKSPHEVFQSAIAEMKRQLANASAEARLREALFVFREFVNVNVTQWVVGAGDHHHPMWGLVSEALGPDRERNRTEAEWRFIQPGQRDVLSAHPHASDCAREPTAQYRKAVDDVNRMNDKGEVPSDRTADVTKLLEFVVRADSDNTWSSNRRAIVGDARALLDAFVVGRR